jgi:hypothetical protein
MLQSLLVIDCGMCMFRVRRVLCRVLARFKCSSPLSNSGLNRLRVRAAFFAGTSTGLLTFQPINCPFFELLERYLRRGRDGVEIETVIVFLLFPQILCELLLFGVENTAPFGV